MIVTIQFLAIILAMAMMTGVVFNNPESIRGSASIDSGLVSVLGILLISSALKKEGAPNHIFLIALLVVATAGLAMKIYQVLRLGLRPGLAFLIGAILLVSLWLFFPGVGSLHGVGLLVGILLIEYIQLIYSMQRNPGCHLRGGRAKSERVEPRILDKKDGKSMENPSDS